MSTVVILGTALKVRSYRKRVAITEGSGDAIAGLYDTIDNVGVAPPLPLRKGVEMFSNEAYLSHTEAHLLSEGGTGASAQEEDYVSVNHEASAQEEDYESVDHRANVQEEDHESDHDLADRHSLDNENVMITTTRDGGGSIELSENEAYSLSKRDLLAASTIYMPSGKAHSVETVDMVENEAYSLSRRDLLAASTMPSDEANSHTVEAVDMVENAAYTLAIHPEGEKDYVNFVSYELLK